MKRVKFYFDGSYNKSVVTEEISFLDNVTDEEIDRVFKDWIRERVHAYWIEEGNYRNPKDARQESFAKWISVKDRLPNIGNIVLVSGTAKLANGSFYKMCEFATYTKNKGWILESYPEKTGIQITHWMPLPKPPLE